MVMLDLTFGLVKTGVLEGPRVNAEKIGHWLGKIWAQKQKWVTVNSVTP